MDTTERPIMSYVAHDPIRAQRGAARALTVELVRLLVMHGAFGATQNLNKGGAPLQISLAC